MIGIKKQTLGLQDGMCTRTYSSMELRDYIYNTATIAHLPAEACDNAVT